MNKLSLLFVTVVVGTFMTFGETCNKKPSGKSSKEAQLSVEESSHVEEQSSMSIIHRINQNENMTLLETGLEDLREALAQIDPTVMQETKENKDKVLSRLGELLENHRFNDAIKQKVARILRLSCTFNCDHVIKLNLSELLIKKLNENSNSVDTKAEILFVLNLAAENENSRNILVDQGIIESVTTLVEKHNERPKSQYVLNAAASLIKNILSFKDLDSKKAHSLVPVLIKLLEYDDLDEESALKGLTGSQERTVARSIYREKRDSGWKIESALDAIVNLLTEQTCMKGFHDTELIACLARFLDDSLYQFRSVKLLEKLYGFTQDGSQKIEWELRLKRIRDRSQM